MVRAVNHMQDMQMSTFHSPNAISFIGLALHSLQNCILKGNQNPLSKCPVLGLLHTWEKNIIFLTCDCNVLIDKNIQYYPEHLSFCYLTGFLSTIPYGILECTPPKIQKLYKELQEWKKHGRQWEWSSNWLLNNLGHWGMYVVQRTDSLMNNGSSRMLPWDTWRDRLSKERSEAGRTEKAELLPYLIPLLSWQARWQDVGQPRLTKTAWLWDRSWGRGLQIALNCSLHKAGQGRPLLPAHFSYTAAAENDKHRPATPAPTRLQRTLECLQAVLGKVSWLSPGFVDPKTSTPPCASSAQPEKRP